MENLDDVGIFREKSRFFLGRVKIQLTSLDFDRNIQLHERAHVDKLVSVFRGEGCHRLDPWNHVPVIVGRNTLSTRLRLARLRSEDLIREGEPPLLEFTAPLRVLHGRRRLLAAEEYLWDKWWIAELYSNGMHHMIFFGCRLLICIKICQPSSKYLSVNNIHIQDHSAMATSIAIS
jgi:hypothetical protein